MAPEKAKAFLAEFGALMRKYEVEVWSTHETGEIGVSALGNYPADKGGWLADFDAQVPKFPLNDLRYDDDAPVEGLLLF